MSSRSRKFWAPIASTLLMSPPSTTWRAISSEAAASSTPGAPSAVRDSKLLRPAVRQELVPQIRSWAVGSAVGMASPSEIDALGIVGALRLAGRRALEDLDPTAQPDLVLLDLGLPDGSGVEVVQALREKLTGGE